MLREQVAKKTALVDAGQLVSDNIMMDMIRDQNIQSPKRRN